MWTFKLEENDLAFNTDRNIVMIEGNGEIAQALERAFTTNQGEWFLNTSHGLNYPNIRGKGVTDDAIQLEIIQTALQEPRMEEVTGIDISRDNIHRTVDITFDCLVNLDGNTTDITIPITI